jgi:VanZ family protein
VFRSRNLFWVPVILWAGIIFSLSSIPNLNSGLSQDLLLRKLAHITEYFILAILIYRTLLNLFAWKKSRILLSVTMLCVLYAISDEAHQFFVAGRTAAVRDIVIDCIGIFIFLGWLGPERLRRILLGTTFCFMLACPAITPTQATAELRPGSPVRKVFFVYNKQNQSHSLTYYWAPPTILHA